MTASYSSYMTPVDYEAGLMTVGDFDTVESYSIAGTSTG